MGIHLTKSIIFDLDGTLIDSEQAIHKCFQKITKKLAPNRIEYAKNILIGPPLRSTASEILGPNHQESLDIFVQLFIEMHDDQVTQHVRPYPNVIKVLNELDAKNISMALATNKRSIPTKKLINFFGWNKFFKYIECSDRKNKIQTKVEMIRKIIKNDESFKKSLYLGDTHNDYISARANKIEFIRAEYGYGSKEVWDENESMIIIRNISELLNIIL